MILTQGSSEWWQLQWQTPWWPRPHPPTGLFSELNAPSLPNQNTHAQAMSVAHTIRSCPPCDFGPWLALQQEQCVTCLVLQPWEPARHQKQDCLIWATGSSQELPMTRQQWEIRQANRNILNIRNVSLFKNLKGNVDLSSQLLSHSSYHTHMHYCH